MKRINKEIGARVLIREVLVEISPKAGWRYMKNVHGTIVERGEHQQYYHTSNGGSTNPRKCLIDKDVWPNFAVKLDDELVDIEGNNIVVFREWNLKFLDRIEIKAKLITEKQYLAAKKNIEKYEKQ